MIARQESSADLAVAGAVTEVSVGAEVAEAASVMGAEQNVEVLEKEETAHLGVGRNLSSRARTGTGRSPPSRGRHRHMCLGLQIRLLIFSCYQRGSR